MTRRRSVALAAAVAIGVAAGILSHAAGRLGLIESRAVAAGDTPAARWDGYVYAPASRVYELRVVGTSAAQLWVDGRLIFETAGTPEPPPARVHLEQGQHLVGITFASVPDSSTELQWDLGNPFRLTAVPPEAVSPRPLRAWKWAARPAASATMLAVCTAWSLLVLIVAGRWVWRRSVRELRPDRPLLVTLAGLALLFTAGIWWGGSAGWAADAIDPESVRQAALVYFSYGWHDKYPPLHYYLLTVLYLPTFVAHHLGWLSLESDRVQVALNLTGRLLSVVMALATVLAVALVAARTTDRRHAWPAALCAGCFLPFAFYAKTTNVDLPFVCWFAWSLLFLVRLWGHEGDEGHEGRTEVLRDTEEGEPSWPPAVRNAIALGITAAAAVATKDQAYGLYVLPALMLLWRFGRSLAGLKVLAAGSLAAVITLAVCYNVLFNPTGLPLHIEFISGPASTAYRMFEWSPRGQWDLLKSSAGQLLSATGIAGALMIAAGIGSPYYARSAGTFLLLGASALSYYLTFIAYAGYVYDRFLMPVTCILALYAAVGVRRLLDSPAPVRIAAYALLGWMVARPAAVDLLLIRDSRVTVEAWLRSHVQRDETVGAVNQYGYIPRLYEFRRVWLSPTIEATRALQPDYIVVNREYAARFGPETEEHAWITWLESGASPYDEVLRHKAPLSWTPLAFDRRFTDRVHDPFTNLDKANPEMVVFKRRR